MNDEKQKLVQRVLTATAVAVVFVVLVSGYFVASMLATGRLASSPTTSTECKDAQNAYPIFSDYAVTHPWTPISTTGWKVDDISGTLIYDSSTIIIGNKTFSTTITFGVQNLFHCYPIKYVVELFDDWSGTAPGNHIHMSMQSKSGITIPAYTAKEFTSTPLDDTTFTVTVTLDTSYVFPSISGCKQVAPTQIGGVAFISGYLTGDFNYPNPQQLSQWEIDWNVPSTVC